MEHVYHNSSISEVRIYLKQITIVFIGVIPVVNMIVYFIKRKFVVVICNLFGSPPFSFIVLWYLIIILGYGISHVASDFIKKVSYLLDS